MSEGARRIAAERERQVSAEGWSAEHDDGHTLGNLAVHAAALAVWGTDARVVDPHGRGSIGSDDDDYEDAWGLQAKHSGASEVRRLEIAGALIAAEIDRLLRLEVSR